MNQSQHDELADLFSQRMTFSPEVAQQDSRPVLGTADSFTMQDEKLVEPAFVSISAHYTHTTHLRPTSEVVSEPSRSPPPPYDETTMPQAMAQLLLENSINPNALLPNQIQLFGNADYEQRLRLLELWRISPPNYMQASTAWSVTSIQQEEILAKARFETNMAARAIEAYQRDWPKTNMDFDTHIQQPISPIRGPGEDAWPPAARMRAASIAASRTVPKATSEAEPYVVSGYQISSRMDPVYAAAPSLWQTPSYAQPAQTMENQYGDLMQIRNHADWQAANEQIGREKMHDLTNADADMVM